MRARYEISGMRLIWSRGSWPVGQEVSAGPRREFDDELHRRDRVVTANDDGRNRTLRSPGREKVTVKSKYIYTGARMYEPWM